MVHLRGTRLALFATTLVAGAVLLAPLAPAQQFIRGDVNDDAMITIADFSRLVGYVMLDGSAPVCIDSADIDDDGQIALTDAIWMISFLFGPSGAAALPAPYPDPGLDPTADALAPCGESDDLPSGDGDEPIGSELPHIYFFTPEGVDDEGINEGFAVAPGQSTVLVPIRADMPLAVEGFTISLSFDPDQIAAIALDFEEGVPRDHNADLRISHLSPMFPGRIYGYVVMEFLPPILETSFPAGSSLLLGHVVLTLREDLAVGSELSIGFETLPSSGAEPPIRNEVVPIVDGSAIFPQTTALTAPVVPETQIFVRGDANRDGHLDISDGVSLLQFLYLGNDARITCLDACDVDDSGQLDLGDPIALFAALFELSVAAPPAKPFPYQGIDPTDTDPFGCEPTMTP